MKERVSEIGIHIVDDDEAVRDALIYLLEGEGYQCKSFESAENYLDSHAIRTDVVVVLDIRMVNLSGIDLFRHMKSMDVMPPVIFLTGHGDVPLAVEAMRQGAFDFHEKPFDEMLFLDAVSRAAKQVRDNLARHERQSDHAAQLATLSPREKDVMALMLEGKANKVIAHELNISLRTTEVHRSNVLKKMAATSVVTLIKKLSH